jgi:hypothetical protein
LIVIDCSDLPPDFYQVYMYLKQFVQPDWDIVPGYYFVHL